MEASAAAGAGGGEPEPEASAPEPEVSGRRSSVIDMSQWMSADGQLQGLLTTKPDPLEVLVGISRSLSTGLSFQDLIDSIVHSAKQLIECDRATLWLCDHEKEELYSFIADGGKTFRQHISKGIVGESATKNEAINIEDAYKDPRETDPSDLFGFVRESQAGCLPQASTRRSISSRATRPRRSCACRSSAAAATCSASAR